MSHRSHTHRLLGASGDFDTHVLHAPLPVLVSFELPWSGSLTPGLAGLARAFAGRLQVVRVNLARYSELAIRFQVRVLPTLLLFKGGNMVEFLVGPVPTWFVLETVSKALGLRPECNTASANNPLGLSVSLSPGGGEIRMEGTRGGRRSRHRRMLLATP